MDPRCGAVDRMLFVLFMSWPHIPDCGVRIVVLLAAAAVLIFNTASIAAMVKNYAAGQRIHLWARYPACWMKQPKQGLRSTHGKIYPTGTTKVMQWFDIIFVVAAIFLALWFPLYKGWAGVSRSIDKIENPTWEALKQTPAQVNNG